MKFIFSVLFFFLFTNFISNGQNMDVAENDKAVIYFIEMTKSPLVTMSGVVIYDNHEPIGMVPLKYYLRYECPSGEHLFYSITPENSYFVEANLKPGKVYIIEVNNLPGVWLPEASIKPVNTTQKFFDIEIYRNVVNKKKSKSFYKTVDKLNNQFLKRAEKNKLGKYQNNRNKYDRKKSKEKVKMLYPHWHIESEYLLLDSKERKGIDTS